MSGLRPAHIDFSDPDAPRAPDFDDVYHSRAGAWAQARHVFLGGNGLPARWRARTRFVVLETGFGLGNNFLATWAAWRTDPHRAERLVFVSIEKHPPRREDLARAHAGCAEPALAQALQAQWPPLTPDLHTLDFDGGRVRLLLALGDIAHWLPQLVLQADAFFLDGFAPERNPEMWQAALLQRLDRLAAPGATAATWSVARDVRDGLTQAGFAVQKAPGFSGKREMTVAQYAPRHVPRLPASRQVMHATADEPVLVIGAGLAGACAARALADQGLHSLVLERHGTAAAETSGNPGGMFHGVVHADDGAHARWHRAAALRAGAAWRALIAEAGVPGRVDGLLRLESRLDLAAMQALIDRHGLPPEYLQALDVAAAARLAGVPLPHPAWWYPDAGWISPAAAVPALLARAGVDLRTGCRVAALRRAGDAWQAEDEQGRTLARARHVVLANAADARRLLGDAWPATAPNSRLRGQITRLAAGTAGLRSPACPIAGGGYALTLADGDVVCGATQQRGDDDPTVRAADHAHNLAQLARLTGATVDDGAVTGRVGWRWQVDDRLPLVGPAPVAGPLRPPARLDQPRTVPRQDGLWLLGALGSRGLTHGPLAGELLAAWMTGAPWPVGSALADRVDLGRFSARRA